MSTLTNASGEVARDRAGERGRIARISVRSLTVEAGGRPILDGVSLEIAPGELFAIAGTSGAGKSTLLESIAGIRRATSGRIEIGEGIAATDSIGFVPQDDIVHRDLPLGTGLRYAAQLRLPARTSRVEIDEVVDRVVRELGLDRVVDTRVGDLSGGQRKRASIAMELLTRPEVILLDEPTSGLDPATAAEVMDILRRLASAGTTVVVTTHHLDELEQVDRFAFLGAGGRPVLVGSADDARAALGGADLTGLYSGLLPPVDASPTLDDVTAAGRPQRQGPRPRPGALHRWWVLTRRSIALLGANKLTLAILFGSPAMVITMMVVLFPPAGAPGSWSSSATVQLPFWTAFSAFFFGLTAGLLQIVPEAPIAARERRVGVGATPYVLSKVAALSPTLIGVSVGMLVALQMFDRLPTGPGWSPVELASTMLLLAASALALGLLASALVRDAAQAALALPMLCFPQVLFAGAVVGIDDMAPAGRFISYGMSTRWGFEGITDSLGLGGTGSPMQAWTILAAMTLALLGATVVAVRSRR